MPLTDKQKEYQRRYYLKHREKRLAYLHEWRANNPDKVKEGCREYQRNNRARIRDWKRQYRAERPQETKDRHRVYAQTRRALKAAAQGVFSVEQWIGRCSMFLWRCAYCGKDLSKNTVHMDHVIPLSKGGSNWPANLVPACQPCNGSKHNQVWIPLVFHRKASSI